MTLVAANVALPDPAGVEVVRVGTAEELREAVLAAAAGADVVVMAAAVADFRPGRVGRRTRSRRPDDPAGAPQLRAGAQPRHPRRARRRRGAAGQVVVGFAAETGDDAGDVLAHGRAKLARKGCDLLVVNDVGGGRRLRPARQRRDHPRRRRRRAPTSRRARKEAVADAVWDAVADLLRLPVTSDGRPAPARVPIDRSSRPDTGRPLRRRRAAAATGVP